jgi:hypothetical protein
MHWFVRPRVWGFASGRKKSGSDQKISDEILLVSDNAKFAFAKITAG